MKKIYYLLSVSLLLLPGCSTTRITHSWKAENTMAKSFNKILVLGLNGEKDIRTRESMENHLVGDLKNAGFIAVSALREYGPKAFLDMTEKEAIAKLENSKVDAVLTIVMLDKSKEKHYVPGNIYYSPYIIYHRRFWGYYTTIHQRIYTPGYYATNTRYFWESNLYDIKSRELLYSVQTESFEPASTETLAHEYGKLIVSDLIGKNVLNKQQVVAKNGF